jgi:hypothetical protein
MWKEVAKARSITTSKFSVQKGQTKETLKIQVCLKTYNSKMFTYIW